MQVTLSAILSIIILNTFHCLRLQLDKYNKFRGQSRIKYLILHLENPFSNLFGKSMDNDPSEFNDRSPSWNDIESLLIRKETFAERREFNLQREGRGGSNNRANIRLFDEPDNFVPLVTFYRDTAAWCPYCEKVWLQLEEKKIPYKVEKVPLRCYGTKPRSFMEINPSGGLPVATIRGRTMKESNDIMMELERSFPHHTPLLPKEGSPQSARVTPLLKLEVII